MPFETVEISLLIGTFILLMAVRMTIALSIGSSSMVTRFLRSGQLIQIHFFHLRGFQQIYLLVNIHHKSQNYSVNLLYRCQHLQTLC